MCYMFTKVILFFWCNKSFYEKLLRIVDSKIKKEKVKSKKDKVIEMK